VTGTLGGLDMLADAMREVSALLGGRSVAIAQYQTSTPDVPLTVSARGSEPVVVTLGEEEWELPDR
jgi:PHD/YefM family antitoxin component YafN of YafNO toxin-antitoxin module